MGKIFKKVSAVAVSLLVPVASFAAITMPATADSTADYMTVAAWVAGLLAIFFGVKKAIRLISA